MGFVTPDFGTIFWMVISFAVVLFILRKFAWRPILNALKTREYSISDALNAAEIARQQVAELKAGNEVILIEARKEKNLIIQEAHDMKEKILAEAREQARMEMSKSVAAARSQIELEKNAMLNEMKKQLADLSVVIAEQVIRRELESRTRQEQLIDSLLDDLKLN